MAYLIKFTAQPEHHDIQTLSEGISLYAKEQRNHKPIEPFGFFIRDKNDQVWGGCNEILAMIGFILISCGYINHYVAKAMELSNAGC